MTTRDTRSLHRRRDPERVRHFGKQESSTELQSPFGQIPFRTAGAISRQQVQPLLQGLGLGVGRGAQRLQRQIESGQARGPLAAAIQSIQQFAPNVLPSAQALGARLAGQGEQAVQGLQAAIAAAQGQMPQYQAAGLEGLEAARQQLGGARSLYEQAAAQLPALQALSRQGVTGAQQALDLARGYTTGPAMTGQQAAVARAQELLRGGAAQTGAEQALARAQALMGGAPETAAGRGLELAQRYAEQAASPIGGEDLYQVAARRVLGQIRPGLAARGLEAGGAGAQAEQEMLRNLTFQFAQQRGQERQQTLQGLQGAAQGLSGLQQAGLAGVGQAAGQLGGLQQQALGGLGQATGQLGQLQQAGLAGLGQAATGLQQAAANQSALGATLLPYLQAMQQAGQGIGQAAQTGAGLTMTGPQLAQQQASAVQQLGQALAQQYGIPMQQAGQLLNLLTAGTQPGLALTQATAPVGVPSSKGMQVL
jgi:hypothetical protein